MVKDYMRYIHTILTLICVLSLASCDVIIPRDALHRHDDNALEITSMQFSEDYRRIFVRMNVTKDIPNLNIADTAQVDIRIKDTYCHMMPVFQLSQPTLSSVAYIAPDDIHATGLTVLALIDLSQPAPVMKKQMEYVRKLYSLFSRDNLYLAFMLPDGKVSQTFLATDYIVSHYIAVDSPLLGPKQNNTDVFFLAEPDTLTGMARKQHALLYRSVSSMLYMTSGHSGTNFDSSRLTSLVIFSDGQVYDEADNLPLDPEHFTIQERLINQSNNLPSNVAVFYVNLATGKVASAMKDGNMMRMLCMRSNGKYMTGFDWIALSGAMMDRFNIQEDEYLMELSNNEGKIYFGNLRNLQVRIYKKGTDELLAECNSEYRLGTVNSPLIVGNRSYVMVYMSGLLITLLIIVAVFIILQFILPYVRYCIFRSRYVVKYAGQNMSVQGKLVADTCYFCKAPFQVGDTIVAKCQHTMHEECWNENDQHCPEHGKHCPEGAHFYDPLNIFNPRNGSYLTRWVIFGIFASAISWFIMVSSYHPYIFKVISHICESLKASKPDIMVLSPEAGEASGIMSIVPRMYLLPIFGLYLTPILTIVFSMLSCYHRRLRYRVLDIASRAAVVLVLSLLIFLMEFIAVLICDTFDGSFIFDWLPWSAVTYLILFASTVHTRIHDLHSRTMLCVSFAMGAVNAVMWGILGTFDTKDQIINFIFLFILYAVVLAVTIARKLPVSEKYFLHVKGEVKEMDIALYKWLRQTPDACVTIGRSVDCQLQISWDTSSDIAPIHAVIRQKAGLPYLSSAGGTVVVGTKPLSETKAIRLRHGMSFRIGTTVFTFVEM